MDGCWWAGGGSADDDVDDDDDDDDDDDADDDEDEENCNGTIAGIGGKSGHASTCGKRNNPPAGGDASCRVTPSCGA
jgi:hypothetical protein